FRFQQVRRKLRDGHGITKTAGTTKHVFGGIDEAVETRPTTGENDSRAEELVHARLAKVLAKEFHQLTGSRLQDFAERALLKEARRAVADGRNFDLVAFRNAGDNGAAEHFFDVFGVGNGRAKTDGNVISEVVAADRHRAGMNYNTLVVSDDVG